MHHRFQHVHVRDYIVCVLLLPQEGVAVGLEREMPLIGQPESFFRQMQQEFFSKRDQMAEVLSAVGLKPIVPESGYFMIADTSPLGMSAAHMHACLLLGFSVVHQMCWTSSGLSLRAPAISATSYRLIH